MKSFQVGQTTIGLMRLDSRISGCSSMSVGSPGASTFRTPSAYEYESLPEYDKFVGRVIVRYKNKSQQMVRKAEPMLGECEVSQILPDVFDNDVFPGYENVDLSWRDLGRVLTRTFGVRRWKTRKAST